MTGLSGDVLITGGAGFLARAIYRRARREGWDARFTALSRDDAKHAELQRRYPEVRSVLCDVGCGDLLVLAAAMTGHQTVIHAAASKYVDRAELNAWDTVQTNVYGSQAVAEAAMMSGVEQVVGISTDKACQPVNIYGFSKAVMERQFQEADRLTDTRFVVVRYGNVVASTGSVVPLFRKQLAETGRIQITDPKMTRFWMSVDQAIDLIVDALEDAEQLPGHVFVPSPAAMEIGDLALIALGETEHGPLPEDRVEIVGMRPGEKRHEKLIHRQESTRVVEWPDDLVAARAKPWAWAIAPPGRAEDGGYAPFEVTSDQPTSGWLAISSMIEYMNDSEEV